LAQAVATEHRLKRFPGSCLGEMARGMLWPLLVVSALCSARANEADLLAQLKELEQEFQANRAEIEALTAKDAAQHRRLSPVEIPSIYGDSDKHFIPEEYTPVARTAQEELEGALTHLWLLLAGALVMFMQAGFAMLEAGACRKKFVQNILLKNLTDVAIGTFGWWIFGWSFAYSGHKNEEGFLFNHFIGYHQFAGSDFALRTETLEYEPKTDAINWFFQWAFASAAATIVSGGVAERVKFPGYCIYSFLLTSFVYPTLVAWTWGYGFLAEINVSGYVDFAGSGIVHMCGGVGALVGAVIAGPRAGRFKSPRFTREPPLEKDAIDPYAPHSLPLIVLGTFILWFGWYGFNCGSTLSMASNEDGFKAAQVAMNTTISASACGVVVFLMRFAILRRYEVGQFCNGILAGLVSITAGCSNVECGSALCIGIIGAIVFTASSLLLQFVKVDDPLDAFAIHGACGAWGVFAAALFDWGDGFKYVHGWSGFKCLMRDGECAPDTGAAIIGANAMEILVVVLWVGDLSILIFAPLWFFGLLTASDEEQAKGFDQSKHTPQRAYDYAGHEPLEAPSNNKQSNQQSAGAGYV